METLQFLVFVPSLLGSLTSGCFYPTDVVFLLDGSESVSESSFLQQKAFVVVNTNTLQMMAQSLKNVHVGVEVFSSDVNVITQLDKPTLPDTFSNFVLAADQPRDGTRTNVALRTLRYMVSQQSRKNSLLKAVLITDGYSKDVAKTIEEAQRAKNIGVEFIFIGIGNSIKTEEVAGMTDDYSKVFMLKSFDELAGVSDQVRDAICSGTPRSSFNGDSSKSNFKRESNKTTDPSSISTIPSAPTTRKLTLPRSSTARTLYATASRKPNISTKYTTSTITSPSTTTTTATTVSTSTTSTTSKTTSTTISSTSQIAATKRTSTTTTTTTTTTTNPATTLITSTPNTMTTHPPTTLPTSTTTRRLYASSHFTLVPLTVLGGFGGSETLMDIFRGSRYYSPKSKTSYGMRIPFPLFLPRGHVTLSPFEPPRTTMSPYRYLVDVKKTFNATTPEPIQTKITSMTTSSAPPTVSSKRTVPLTTSTTTTAKAIVTSSTTTTQTAAIQTIKTSITSINIKTTGTTTTTISHPNITQRSTTAVSTFFVPKLPNVQQLFNFNEDSRQSFSDPECLRKSPVDGEPTKYYERDGPFLHKRSCPVGVAFDTASCTCILHTSFVTSDVCDDAQPL